MVLTDREGKDIPVNMIQKWPVKKAMTNYKEKPRPYKLDVYKRQVEGCRC